VVGALPAELKTHKARQANASSSGFYCEEVFTIEAQRGRGATETRNISRKDAKVAKVGE
jgi:hypothetical protein